MGKEIERKWIVQVEPSILNNWEAAYISQYYTSISEDKEVRYRRKNSKFYKTVKAGNGLEREEFELEVSKEEFENNIPNKVGNVIRKKRYTSNDGLEFDEYLSPILKGKYILEKEFNSTEEAQNFVLPEFIKIIKEVTHDKNYKNKNIALSGFPEEWTRLLG